MLTAVPVIIRRSRRCPSPPSPSPGSSRPTSWPTRPCVTRARPRWPCGCALTTPRPRRPRRAWGWSPSGTCSSTCRATGARPARWPSSSPGRPPPSWWRCARSPRGRCGGAECGRSSRPRWPTARGAMKATFFNQPWLASKYPAGTRLVLHGKFEARNRFRVQGHARTTEASAGADGVAHYPATEGLSSTQILAMVRAHAGALADVPEPLPAELRVAERLPGRRCALTAVHLEGDEEQAHRPPPAGLRRAPARPARAAAPPPAAARRQPGAGARRRARAQRALAGRHAAVRPHRRTSGTRWRRSTPTWPGTGRCSGC